MFRGSTSVVRSKHYLKSLSSGRAIGLLGHRGFRLVTPCSSKGGSRDLVWASWQQTSSDTHFWWWSAAVRGRRRSGWRWTWWRSRCGSSSFRSAPSRWTRTRRWRKWPQTGSRFWRCRKRRSWELPAAGKSIIPHFEKAFFLTQAYEGSHTLELYCMYDPLIF